MLDKKTSFTDANLRELEEIFQEQTTLTTAEQMHYQRGQRSVIKHVQMLIEQAKNRGRVK